MLAPQSLPLHPYRPLGLEHARIFFQQGLRHALLHVQGGVLLERQDTGFAFPQCKAHSHPRSATQHIVLRLVIPPNVRIQRLRQRVTTP